MRPSSRSVNRATAALIPSSEVPDIKPTTTPLDTLALFDRWWRVFSDAADHPAIFSEQLFCRIAAHAFLLHYDRELHAFSGALEQPCRFIARDAADFHHDALAAVDEFVVGSAQIHH